MGFRLKLICKYLQYVKNSWYQYVVFFHHWTRGEKSGAKFEEAHRPHDTDEVKNLEILKALLLSNQTVNGYCSD